MTGGEEEAEQGPTDTPGRLFVATLGPVVLGP